MSDASVSLVQQVQEALAAIPHTGPFCGREGSSNICACDREQRIAQRVAAAIQAAISETAREWGSPYGPSEGFDPEGDALAALRGEAS